jgi:hypothetical protein
MKTYKVIKLVIEIVTSKMQFATAGFGEDLTQSYGEHHFITPDAEVGLIKLTDQPEEWAVLDEIDNYIKLVSVDAKSQLVPAIQKDAWRYFADLSPLGNIWYLENILTPILYRQAETGEKLTEIISKEELFVVARPVSYNKWNALSPTEKTNLAKKFVSQPIKGNWPIEDSPYHTSRKNAG